MRVKVRGGTVDHGQPSLCLTCRFATIVKGSRLGDDIVHCGAVRDRIGFAVTSCTEFVERNHPSLYEMEDMAWVLRSDPKRNQVGFVPAM
jgi:hypothetical protein